jgi:hypothetical protein
MSLLGLKIKVLKGKKKRIPKLKFIKIVGKKAKDEIHTIKIVVFSTNDNINGKFTYNIFGLF